LHENVKVFIPDISRERGVHLQGTQGRSRSKLLQSHDNAANGRLGHARRVKIFEKLKLKMFGTNRHLTTLNINVNNRLVFITNRKTFRKFS
jgi:hypothetical protein